MSNLMLSLDDAVMVAKRISDYDEEILRNEFEQKCWIDPYAKDGLSRVVSIIMDVNPKEIANQIKNDNLSDWCQRVQVAMQMALKCMSERSENGEIH